MWVLVVGPRVRREDLPSETPETPPARQNWRVTGRDGIGHWSKLERVDRGPGRTPLKVVLSSGAEVVKSLQVWESFLRRVLQVAEFMGPPI